MGARKMIRYMTLACAALALLLPLDSSRAADSGKPKISCKTILPKAAIPNDPGFFVEIEEVTIAGRNTHRIFHEPAAYYYVASGSGLLSIDGQPDLPLVTGSVAVVPSRAVHQVHNTSDNNAPLVIVATLLETSQEHVLTGIVDGPDVTKGCSHNIQ